MIMKIPHPNQVVKLLFEHFCEDCESGEEGCIQIVSSNEGFRCPVFDAVMAIDPDNPFVRRSLGKFMPCDKCGHKGLRPPEAGFPDPQPVWVCQSCGAALWRDAIGILVDDVELAGKEPQVVEIGGENGSLSLRVVCHHKMLEKAKREAEIKRNKDNQGAF